MNVPQEDVLVVPRAVFERAGVFQGFCGDTATYLPLLLDPRHTLWRPRGSVEEDPSFKQLLPYCVLAWKAVDGATRYFAYTRGGGQGEARLRAKRSIGIGGHISSCDGEHG
ncbi:MAG: phosphoesterase, partial [Planctomycetia bacterium]